MSSLRSEKGKQRRLCTHSITDLSKIRSQCQSPLRNPFDATYGNPQLKQENVMVRCNMEAIVERPNDQKKRIRSLSIQWKRKLSLESNTRRFLPSKPGFSILPGILPWKYHHPDEPCLPATWRCTMNWLLVRDPLAMHAKQRHGGNHWISQTRMLLSHPSPLGTGMHLLTVRIYQTTLFNHNHSPVFKHTAKTICHGALKGPKPIW